MKHFIVLLMGIVYLPCVLSVSSSFGFCGIACASLVFIALFACLGFEMICRKANYIRLNAARNYSICHQLGNPLHKIVTYWNKNCNHLSIIYLYFYEDDNLYIWQSAHVNILMGSTYSSSLLEFLRALTPRICYTKANPFAASTPPV